MEAEKQSAENTENILASGSEEHWDGWRLQQSTCPM